jgi:hypothetical protein
LERYLRNHWYASTREVELINIESGQVNKFRRWPSDLAKYFAFKTQILANYPSIEKFVLKERLHWSDPPIAHSQLPYTDSRIISKTLQKGNTIGDYQIRLNDHPYAFTPDITHIVVWSAIPFPPHVDRQERMKVYENFVEKHFSEIPKEKRLWFLNWGSIQSVPGLEVRRVFCSLLTQQHFHVLLRDADSRFIEKVTIP